MILFFMFGQHASYTNQSIPNLSWITEDNDEENVYEEKEEEPTAITKLLLKGLNSL